MQLLLELRVQGFEAGLVVQSSLLFCEWKIPMDFHPIRKMLLRLTWPIWCYERGGGG